MSRFIQNFGRFRRSAQVAVAMVALCFVSVSVRAAEEADTERGSTPAVVQLNNEGAQLYKKRDYRRAVEKFLQAYATDGDPNLLFNIARCYEKLGDTGAAIEKYEEFLKTEGAEAAGRERAQRSLAALQKLERADTASREAPAVTSGSQAQTRTETTEDPERATRVWPWLTLGSGILAAGVGGTLYALGVNDHSTLTSAPGYGDPNAVYGMTESRAQDLADRGDTKKLVGGIALGVGGALIATSVVLLITRIDVGSSSERPVRGRAQAVSLSLEPTSRGGTFTVRGSF